MLKIEHTHGTAPPFLTFNSALLGAYSRVTVRKGTPQDNDADVQFPEAVLIWRPGMDWHQALAGIALNTQAARWGRAPLRMEQICLDLDDVDAMLDLRARGVWQWRFIPLSQLTHKFQHLTCVAQTEPGS